MLAHRDQNVLHRNVAVLHPVRDVARRLQKVVARLRNVNLVRLAPRSRNAGNLRYFCVGVALQSGNVDSHIGKYLNGKSRSVLEQRRKNVHRLDADVAVVECFSLRRRESLSCFFRKAFRSYRHFNAPFTCLFCVLFLSLFDILFCGRVPGLRGCRDSGLENPPFVVSPILSVGKTTFCGFSKAPVRKIHRLWFLRGPRSGKSTGCGFSKVPVRKIPVFPGNSRLLACRPQFSPPVTSGRSVAQVKSLTLTIFDFQQYYCTTKILFVNKNRFFNLLLYISAA